MGTMHGEALLTALIVSVNDEYIFVNKIPKNDEAMDASEAMVNNKVRCY